MAKPPIRAPKLARFRVIKKCFINGSMRDPGEIVEIDETLVGSALERIEAPPSPAPNGTQLDSTK